MTTKRQKLQAMAEQTASPAEAEVAKAMLAKQEGSLDAIADDIRTEWGKGIEAQFAVGRKLAEAWAIFKGDKVAYGRWCQEQAFPFHRNTGQVLRLAAEREPEVRAYLAEVNDSEGSQRDIGVMSAMKELQYGKRPPQGKYQAEVLPVEDATPADPAYAAIRAAAHAIVGTDEEPKNAFLTMHVDDLAKSAGFIKALATAYNEAKAQRSA